MNCVAMVFPYYNAPRMLMIQRAFWASYPTTIKRWHLQIILVDDCSKIPAVDVLNQWPRDRDLNLQIYRINQDILWNQHGARNLGALAAKYRWLLMLDIKHTVSADNLTRLVGNPDLDAKNFYVFPCLRVDWEKSRPMVGYMRDKQKNPAFDKPHPNTYVVAREKFHETGGYDEDYCGTYGGDGPFMRSLEAVAERKFLDSFEIVRWSRDIVSDSCSDPATHAAGKAEYLRIRDEKRKCGRTRAENPLRFGWTRVA